MKLFGEATNNLREKKDGSKVDPNYKGEDLQYLIMESITTAMEVDGFVERAVNEADRYVNEKAEERGIDLSEDSEERAQLIVEASIGGTGVAGKAKDLAGKGKGLLVKVWEFIKKMFRKVANFFRGLVGKFRDLGKLIKETKEVWSDLQSAREEKSLDDEELVFESIDFTGALTLLTDSPSIFDWDYYADASIAGNHSYSALDSQVDEALKDVTNVTDLEGVKSIVQAFNSEVIVDGSNNERSQHKVRASIYLERDMNKVLDDLSNVNPDDQSQDLNQMILDAVFSGEEEEYGAGPLANLIDDVWAIVGDLNVGDLQHAVSEGTDKFEEKVEAFEKSQEELERAVENEEDDDLPDVGDLSGVMNNYATIVGVYSVVTTESYTFGIDLTRKLFTQLKGFGKKALRLYKKADDEGDDE